MREDFGRWLQRQLDRREMTQADFCRATGLGTSTISQLINSNRNPSARLADRIADGLHLDTSDVLRAAGLLDEPGLDSPEVRALIRLLRQVDLLRQDRAETLRSILESWLKADAREADWRKRSG